MFIKDLDGKYKAEIVKMIVIIFILSLIVVAPLFFLNKDKEKVDVWTEDSYKIGSVDKMIESFYEGNLSASQMQSEVNKYLSYEPDFSDDATEEDEIEKALTRTVEMRKVITAYLDGLIVQQKKLNKVTQSVKEDLMYIESLTDEPIEKKELKIKGYDMPLVNGLLIEMENTPLYIHSTENNFKVWVDYDAISREYKKYLTSFHKDLITLHKDVMRFGYTREDGEIDVRNIYNRLLLIDDIQEGNREKDDFYWEKERYQHATLLTGYGTGVSPKWDKLRLTQMEDILSELGEDESLDHRPYERIISNLLESIEDEGGYGEETMRIANKWMHNQFIEYREYLEREQETELNKQK